MTTSDEQLLQDVEGVLELCCEVPRQLQQAPIALFAAPDHPSIPKTAAAALQPFAPRSMAGLTPAHAPAAAAQNAFSESSSPPGANTNVRLSEAARPVGPRSGAINAMANRNASTVTAPDDGLSPAAMPEGRCQLPTAATRHGSDSAVAQQAEAAPHGPSTAGATAHCKDQRGQNGAAHLSGAAAGEEKWEAGWEAGQGQLGCRWLVACLELWDGACWLMRGRGKPPHWLAAVLKAAKCFEPGVRAEAASIAQVHIFPLCHQMLFNTPILPDIGCHCCLQDPTTVCRQPWMPEISFLEFGLYT